MAIYPMSDIAANQLQGILPKRIAITLEDGVLLHNGKRVYFAISPDKISVGCTDITFDALKFIIDHEIPQEKQVIQFPDGMLPP